MTSYEFDIEQESRIYYHPSENNNIQLNSISPIREKSRLKHHDSDIEFRLEFDKGNNNVYFYFNSPDKEANFILSRVLTTKDCLLSQSEIKKLLDNNGFSNVYIEEI